MDAGVIGLGRMGAPMARNLAVRSRMTEAVEAGLGHKDWSAVAGYTLRH